MHVAVVNIVHQDALTKVTVISCLLLVVLTTSTLEKNKLERRRDQCGLVELCGR